MGGTKLTKEEYQSIKNRLKGFSPRTTAEMTKRGYSTIQQIRNSDNWDDYRVKNWKNFTKPTLWEKVRGWFTVNEK